MKRRTSAVELLDVAGDLVGRTAPWAAALWLTAIPARFALAFLIARLLQLGAKAHQHGTHLLHLAYVALGLWLISLWGRQVYVRACRRALEGEVPRGPSGLRVPAGELAAAIGAALAVEAAFWLSLPTIALPVALLPAAALAAVAAPRGGPGLRRPLRELAAGVGSIGTLLFLMFLLAIGLLVAALNLHVLFGLGAWLSQPLLGLEAAAWDQVLSRSNPLYALLLIAGATLLVEPFWLAAMTIYVERVRAASSGEDLRRWFSELKAKQAAQKGAA